MKVCIPTMGKKGMDELVGEHFGRVPTYTIIDTETNEIKIVDNTSDHMGGQGYPADIIARLGIDTMLCGGLGRRAISMFEESGIMVYAGASGTVKEVLESFRSGALQAATDKDACTQHAFRGSHDHGQGDNCDNHDN